MLGVVEVDPLETAPLVIDFVQGSLVLVEPIEIAHQALQARMRFELTEMPFEARVMIPFVPLTKFSAHKQHLLSRMAVHIAVQRSKVGEALPWITRHLVEESPFPMHHFIM